MQRRDGRDGKSLSRPRKAADSSFICFNGPPACRRIRDSAAVGGRTFHRPLLIRLPAEPRRGQSLLILIASRNRNFSVARFGMRNLPPCGPIPYAPLVATKTYQNFIGGEWVGTKSGKTFQNRNPA